MLNRFSILSAACLSVAAGLFVAAAPAPVMPRSQTAEAKLMLPPGIASKDLNADKGIEKSFKNLSEDALTNNGLDNVVGLFVDQDRDRIKKSASSGLNDIEGTKNKGLNDLVASINDAYKNKYGRKMTIDAPTEFNVEHLSIMTGEVSDPNLIAGLWPVDAGRVSNKGAEPGKTSAQDTRETQNKMFGGDVNLEKGRDVAVAHLNGGSSGVTASLIHETLGGWKFDVPNTLTARQLYENLVLNLGAIDLQRLPADPAVADRTIARAVTAALYNIDLSKGTASADLNRWTAPESGTVKNW